MWCDVCVMGCGVLDMCEVCDVYDVCEVCGGMCVGWVRGEVSLVFHNLIFDSLIFL